MIDDITYDVSKFQPLRIRAWLQTGVITDKFLPLDSIIYYHATRMKLGAQVVSLPGENVVKESQHISLPFRKANRSDEAWFYKCSFAQWPSHAVQSQGTFNRPFDMKHSDLIDFNGRKAKVDISRGRYKTYHVTVYLWHALYVDWFADGDKEAIESFLRFCTNLGKKKSQGEGAVLRWEVIEWPEDWSVRGGKDNRLMRNVPVYGDGFKYGLRPSYWLPKHQFTCKMPL